MNRIFLLCLALISLLLVSCGKDAEDEIQDYLDKNNLVAQKTDDGLYYIIEIPGNAVSYTHLTLPTSDLV